MDLFRRVETDSSKLTRLNDLRIYLKVTHISCIANEREDRLVNWELHGPPNTKTDLDWPPRQKPLEENLKAWREMLYRTEQPRDCIHKI